MEKYVTLSLEVHLFFGRIMKEHALFLLAAFPAGETAYRRRADWFRRQFEELLERTVQLADGMVGTEVLNSGEVVTEFTEMAERQTGNLTQIPIDIRITQAEKRLRSGSGRCPDRRMQQQVRWLNQNILRLLNEFIEFKEQILHKVLSCGLYTANYPLLIEHILREAKLYREDITALEKSSCISDWNLQENCCTSGRNPKESEMFWNQIMLEHALFIRGMLDPVECELIETADKFAGEYCRLLEEAEKKDCSVRDKLTEKTLETTERYRDFKAAGAKGITGCDIRSIILPLLADHVLREANHYLRLLKETENGRC